MDKKTKLLIIGRTGSGKDTIAKYLCQKYNMTQLLSYSTRPKRTPDENTHAFITEEEAGQLTDRIAETVINGYQYFATKQQLNENDIYIIDPNGLDYLLESCKNDGYRFIIIYVSADTETRRKRATGRGDAEKEAQIFDKRNESEDEQFTRFENTIESYDNVNIVHNNESDTTALFKEINTIINIYEKRDNDMKDHHDYEKKSIGGSDVAALTLVGCGKDGLKASILHFGGDGEYRAYIVDEECEIPSYYELQEEFTSWMKVYDDEGQTYRADAEIIRIYRAREMGCIIQLVNAK